MSAPRTQIDDRKSNLLQSSKYAPRRAGVHTRGTVATTTRQLVAGIAAVAALSGCTAPNAELGSVSADAIDYNWHVRPILSENCFKCHGPDPSSREAGLRLDGRDFAVAELPQTRGKHAILPGFPVEHVVPRPAR